MSHQNKNYVKEIIDEYNIRFRQWGDSDSWGLTEFKMLEDLIYESSKVRINANTLKRFFHQKTSKPQSATNNALCVFLGYTGYADFIMKKEKPVLVSEKKAGDKPQDFNQGRTRKGVYVAVVILGFLLLFLAAFWNTIKEKYENLIISSIVFQAPVTKGASPYTVKIEYDIPKNLIEHISVDCMESNGDLVNKKLLPGKHDFYATFIYPGTGFCYLKYKGKIIRTIDVTSRSLEWSTYVTDDKNDSYFTLPFSRVDTSKGYLTLPLEEIPQNAVTDKLFVSYTYYVDSIIDGDNFIAEARVRNSAAEDHGIPCYDVMMYVFSNTALHGFALNENCFSYLKFVSGENTIVGSQSDFSRFSFNPSLWHVMRIEVVNKQTTFYLDGETVLQMDYRKSMGAANEITFRFKGCGAVDYVKVMNFQNEIVYQADF
jgi:hypothetical protein